MRLGTLGSLSLAAGVCLLASVLPTGRADGQTITELDVPAGSTSAPARIVSGPGGKLWFTTRVPNTIYSLTTSGSFTGYPLPTINCPSSNCVPAGIAEGDDGNLWYVEYRDGGQVGRMTPSGSVTRTSPPQSTLPFDITGGPDGNLWFTDLNTYYVGRSQVDGVINLYSQSSNFVAVGPDGALWVTFSGTDAGAGIARITTAGSAATITSLPSLSNPQGITTGPDGNLWFTEFDGNKIGRLTTSGGLTEFDVPTSGSAPYVITPGPDGALWFTEWGGNKIGRITTSGVITEFPVPTASSRPYGITTGPDGNIWFCELNSGKIGKLTVPPCPSGQIPSFNSVTSCGASSCTIDFSWGAPTGATPGVTAYELLVYQCGDYCAYTMPVNVVGTTTGLGFSLTGVPKNEVVAGFVHVIDCDVTSPYVLVQDTLQSPPGPAALSLQGTTSNSATLSATAPDGRRFLDIVERKGSGDPAFATIGQMALCPVGTPQTYNDPGLAPDVYQYRLRTIRNFSNPSGPDVYSNTISVPVGCSGPIQCSATVPSNGTAGQAVSFTGDGSASCSPQLTYLWSFGDGQSSGAASPVHTYAAGGPYGWTLTVSAPGYTTCSKNGTITIAGSCSGSVSCDATVPSSGATGQAVGFSGSATLPAGCSGSPTYTWDFGDGNVSAQQSPDHTYVSGGSYNWTLTASAPGLTSCVRSGTIGIASSCSGTIQCSADVPSSATKGASVIFTGDSTLPPGCSQNPSYLWEFGDGSTSTGRVPPHTYTQAGSFAWKLTVSASGLTGCVKSGTISVTEASVPKVTLSPKTVTIAKGSNGSLTATIDTIQGTATSVGVQSSAPSVATVPATVTIGAGSASTTIAVTGVAAGTATVTATLPAALGGASDTAAVTVTGGCSAPGAPAFAAGTASITSGQTYLATWSAASGLDESGSYLLETSRSATFSPLESSEATSLRSATIPTSVSTTDYALHVRVRGVQGCGTAGPNGPELVLTIKATPIVIVITQPGPAWEVVRGGTPPVSSVTFRNVGGQSGRVTLGQSGSFFDVTPGSLDLAPGEEKSVTVTAKASALQSAGYSSGALLGSFGSKTLSTPVTLRVTEKSVEPGSRAGTRARADVTTLVFNAAAGQNPPAQTVTITVDPIVGTDPVYLTPAIGPGGGWLQVLTDLSQPLPPSGKITVSLGVDRSRRTSADGAPPLRTLLQLTAVGASADDAAVIEVVDVEPIPVVPGAGRDTTAGRIGQAAASSDIRSFVVPAAVKGTGQNDAAYFSDGWLRNVGTEEVPVSLYYTPRDANGLTDPGVRKATTTLAAGTTRRLSDLLGSVFQVTSGSGALEVRSPLADALSLRSTVEAVTGGDPTLRFGTDIPIVGHGGGAGLGVEQILPGISDDALRRCNLILSETAGGAAEVEIAVHGADGAVLGTATQSVLPYGQAQINGFVKVVANGVELRGGWASVKVTSGSGRVVGLATVIDNTTNSFSAVLASPIVDGTSSSGVARRAEAAAVASGGGVRRTPRAPGVARSADVAAAFVIPTAVKARGANNSQFVTSLNLVNGRASAITLTVSYLYEDLDAGGTSTVSRQVTLAPRAALPVTLGEDVLTSMFGLQGQSRGWMKVEGEIGSLTGTATISSLVDPNDATKGAKTAQVSGFRTDSSVVMELSRGERRFPGMEKSVSKRSNMILVETSGQAATVRLRGYAQGDPVGERTVEVAPNQYYQINDFFGEAGLNLKTAGFQNVEVTAEVLSGSGRVVGVATVVDNISKNPLVVVLQPSGPGPSTGF